MQMVDSEGPPGPRMGQTAGTRSQRVSYWATLDGKLQRVARVHQYLKPDGTLGASGKPDPKSVFHEGTLYALHRKPPTG